MVLTPGLLSCYPNLWNVLNIKQIPAVLELKYLQSCLLLCQTQRSYARSNPLTFPYKSNLTQAFLLILLLFSKLYLDVNISNSRMRKKSRLDF